MNMGVHISLQDFAFNFFGYIPKSAIAGSSSNSILNFLETVVLFSIANTAFCILTNRTQKSQFLHILAKTCYFLFFLLGVKWSNTYFFIITTKKSLSSHTYQYS